MGESIKDWDAVLGFEPHAMLFSSGGMYGGTYGVVWNDMVLVWNGRVG